VAEAMMEYPGLIEANVYGVAVPDADGRAGMASIVVDGCFDLSGLRQHLANRLPAYARPLFVRIQREMDLTGTFKHKKSDLVAQGYDPSRTADEIYFNDAERAAFVRLDASLYERIQGGRIKL
jgi:fatty-acyl-CoA synthase